MINRITTNTTNHIHHSGRRGRGAVSNDSGRYEDLKLECIDDGWDSLDATPPKLSTTLTEDHSRTLISYNKSPDIGFDRSINPYRGCEHGCIYCYARPTHAWLGLSPGLDFESRLSFKSEAPALLERELRRPGYKCQVIALGSNTDPYQPVERGLNITREILKVLDRFNHPVSIVTKSNLVCRDIDLLSAMAERGLVTVAFSVATLNRKLARILEPRAATPEKRLAAINALAKAQVPSFVMVAPIIPALTDMELEAVLGQAAGCGAIGAEYILLRLPLEIKALWREWLVEHYPDRAGRIMRHIRETRGGKEYDSKFHRRMVGEGPYAELISRRFELTCKRLRLQPIRERAIVNSELFEVPPEDETQLSLL